MPERDDPRPSADKTFVFTDIEGSTRLWEQQPERMRDALARHDALARETVAAHRGRIVKTTGDGIHAVFDDALDALQAVLQIQIAIGEPAAAGALALKLRSGLHAGPSEARDGDFYGPVLNRAARLTGVAHGGQTLLSQAVAERVAGRLPAGAGLIDLGLVRLRDLAQPERVHQLVHPRLRERFPALRSLESTPNNLAQQLNSFVGRERDLADVRERLARTRLLTLLGMGGIGKSRLAVQLGAELLDGYPDGVWLVELAPVADEALVPQTMAAALGLADEPGRTVTESLVAHLRNHAALVILDNCEHVRHAAAELAKRLLQAAAGLKLLATSRDPLQIAGEAVFAVPTLAVPAPERGPIDTQTLAQHASVRLFVDRAAAVQPAFRLDAGNAAAVADICRQLDGIPLALELAAARTRSLPVPAIAQRLADRFRLLVSSDRTVLPRQRTLRALIDWSWDLLDERERTLFRRLAVFAGGCTLEAAEAVAGGDGLDEADVAELLAHLVEKSLVALDPAGGRYRMLDTVRAYAQERLAASGDEAATRRKHLAHAVALAEQARDHLSGPEQGRWLRRLDAERENLLAAHAWCGADPVSRDTGLQLVFLLKIYWHLRGLLGLGCRVTLEALARTGADERSVARCRVLCDAGQLCYYMGRYAQARSHLEASHRLARELGDRARLAAVLPPLGMVLSAMGERAGARAAYEEAVAVTGELGHRRQMAVALNSLAQLYRADGELDRAQSLYEQAIELLDAIGDRESAATAQLNRSMVSISAGRAAEARGWLDGVRLTAADTGSRPLALALLDVAAGLCSAVGDWADCATLYGASARLAAELGMRRESEDEAFLRPLVERARLAIGESAFALHEGAGRALDDDAVAAQVRRVTAAQEPQPDRRTA